MFKSAGLLLILGLAVGLWLGFNPQAHRGVVQSWDNMRSGYLQVKGDAAVKMHDWFTQVNLRTQAPSQPKPQPAASSAWRQISYAFEGFWNSLQRIWLNIRASIR